MVKNATRISNFKWVFSKGLTACLGAMFAVAMLAGQAQAFKIKTTNPDLKINFDNTFTYSNMFRLSDQEETLIGGTRDPKISNKDDGDRNFDQGLVMNRLDWWSEFDLNYKKFGVRFTAAGWYDTVYNTTNDNDSPSTVNSISVPYNEFVDYTRDLHGRDVELMEAFTFGSLYLGDSQLTYKAGQYSLWWGTSFFFGDNGIAGGMSPVNVAKAATLPNVQMKDVILPVPQISANLQVNDSFSLGGYYQFKWKGVRFFGPGSYFSPADLIMDGAERLINGPLGMPWTRGTDLEPDDSGQFGLQIQYQSKFGVDFGAYYLRYHDKGPQVYTTFSGFLEVAPGVMVPIPDKYYLVYPENIQAYGISANTSFGIWTVSGEVTYRTNMPFKSDDDQQALFTFLGQTADNDDNPLYAVGKSLHANLTFFNPGLPATFLSDTADFIVEIGYNKKISIDKNEHLIMPDTTDYGLRMKVVYEPKWYQFLPAFDLSVPIGIEYAPEGRSMVQDTGVHHGGMWTIGVGGTYSSVWNVLLTYVNYYGPTDTLRFIQSHADRDYVGFTLRRAF